MRQGYDPAKALKDIENELIRNIMKNLDKHRPQETKEGYEWAQWQVVQLRELEKYRRNNLKYFKDGSFDEINQGIEEILREYKGRGEFDEEMEILEAIQSGDFEPEDPQFGLGQDFFGINEGMFNNLVNASTADFTRGEWSMLRQADDEYRKIIYNSQIYAAAGLSYEKAVDRACREMIAHGLGDTITYSNGSKHSLPEYARMAIRTGQKRAYLMGEGNINDKYGLHTIRVNTRENACPKCMKWIGRLLIDDVYSGGTAEEAQKAGLPLLSQAMAQGFLHPNCKDGYVAYIEGSSPPPDEEWTREDMERLAEEYDLEQQIKRSGDMMDSYGNLSLQALDMDNQFAYMRRWKYWTDRHKELIEQRDELRRQAAQKTRENAISPDVISEGEKMLREKIKEAKDALKAKTDAIAAADKEVETYLSMHRQVNGLRPGLTIDEYREFFEMRLENSEYAARVATTPKEKEEAEQRIFGYKTVLQNIDEIYANAGGFFDKKVAEIEEAMAEKKADAEADEMAIDKLYNELEKKYIGETKVGKTVLQKWGAQHVREVQRRLDDAPEAMRKVWNIFADRFKLIPREEVPAAKRQYAYYDPDIGAVWINIDKYSGDVGYMAPYTAVFHEFGHMIDALLYADEHRGRAWAGDVASESIANLRDIVYEEAKAYYEKWARTKYNPTKQDFIFYMTFGRGYNEYQKSDTSDLFDTFLNVGRPFGIGHKKGYMNIPSNASTEAFAEFFAGSICNPESFEMLKHFFPKTYAAFLDLIDLILSKYA